MCGRFSLHQIAARLAEVFDVPEPNWTPRYNIAPTQPVLAVGLTVGQHGGDSARAARLLRWGLIPSWAKEETIGSKLINARSETVAEKPSFRSAFKQRRCLILADGFYEWKRMPSKKQPYYFQRTDQEPFAFAGLWEHWHREGLTIDSCTILTTEANALLQPIHDRMPVILSPEDYDRWLDPGTPPVELQTLLRPADPDAMQTYPVSPLVNRPSYDSADCINSL
jgi:putative SOS response-associated peptidase YedK